MTDWFFIRRLTDIIGKHTLLDPEAAKELATNIVNELEMVTETHTIAGGKYLGPVEICRWVTGYFKR